MARTADLRPRLRSFTSRLVPACVALAVTISARAEEAGDAPLPFNIAPDQEEVIGRMLRLDTPAAGHRLAAARIRYARVEADYDRDGRTARVTLVHPSAAPADAPRTERFALLAGDPPPPAALTEALLASIRRHEAGFRWSEPPEPGTPRPTGDPARDAELPGLLAEARYALDVGDRDAALTHVERALELGPESFWVRREAGYVLRRLGEAERARAELEASLALLDRRERAAPEGVGPTWTASRAQALIGLDRLDEAAALLEPLLEGTPEISCQVTRAAQDLLQVEATGEAFDLLVRVIERSPDCADAYVVLAHVARTSGRSRDALPHLAAGADRLPDDPAVVSQHADALKLLGETDEAIAILEALVGRGHDDPSVIASLLGIYTREWPGEEVITGIRARADADPDDHIAAFFTGVFLHYAQDYALSTTYLERMRERLPHEPRVYIYLAMNAFHLGRQAEAVEHIEHAVSLDHPDPDVYYCRAEIRMDEDPRAALRDLERYLALTEGAPDSFPPKQEMVRQKVAALGACLDAPVPSECVVEATEEVAGTEAPSGSRYALVLGLVLAGALVAVGLRRRRAGSEREDA